MNVTSKEFNTIKDYFSKIGEFNVSVVDTGEEFLKTGAVLKDIQLKYLRFYPLTNGEMRPLDNDRKIFVIPIEVSDD